MQSGALMPVGDIWQPVGSLNLKNSEYVHARIVPSAGFGGNGPDSIKQEIMSHRQKPPACRQRIMTQSIY
jgi:hypothetical protein